MEKTIKRLLEKIDKLIKKEMDLMDLEEAASIRSLAGAVLDLARAERTNRESR